MITQVRCPVVVNPSLYALSCTYSSKHVVSMLLLRSRVTHFLSRFFFFFFNATLPEADATCRESQFSQRCQVVPPQRFHNKQVKSEHYAKKQNKKRFTHRATTMRMMSVKLDKPRATVWAWAAHRDRLLLLWKNCLYKQIYA